MLGSGSSMHAFAVAEQGVDHETVDGLLGGMGCICSMKQLLASTLEGGQPRLGQVALCCYSSKQACHDVFFIFFPGFCATLAGLHCLVGRQLEPPDHHGFFVGHSPLAVIATGLQHHRVFSTDLPYNNCALRLQVVVKGQASSILESRVLLVLR